MLKFTKSFKIILPKATNEQVALDITPVIIKLSEAFGGATVTENNGYWVHEGVLYLDENSQIECFYNDLDAKQHNAIREAVEFGFNTAEQLAITIELDGTTYILESVYDLGEVA